MLWMPMQRNVKGGSVSSSYGLCERVLAFIMWRCEEGAMGSGSERTQVSESARRKSISGCQQRCAFSFWQLLMWSFRYEGIRIHLPHWDLVIHAILWRGSPQRRPPPCRRTARRVRGGPRDGSRARRPGASRRACPARVRARATESHQEKVSLY